MDLSPIYRLRVPEVYQSLETSEAGLLSQEAASRQSLFGSNLLSEPPVIPIWRKFIIHLIHPLALLLWMAGILAFAARQPVLGVVIWILLLFNGVFSFWREHRAEQAMEALRHLLPGYARLMRDGIEVKLPSSQVVPGDVLVLAEGDNIPADARVVEEYGLRTNNATLTGEAVPARKTSDASLSEGISELERPNLVFAGTSVVSGTGRAVVYATGMLTQFGRIARLTQEVQETPSLLQRDLVRTRRIISIAALAIGVLVFIIGRVEVGLPLIDAFLLAVGVFVAAVPEGLQATVTLTLAMAGQRLAQRGVLVKKLSMIETMGTVSVVCTDKSGTLTQNQMTVREMWVAGQRLSLSGVGYEPKGEITPNPVGQPHEVDLQAILTAAMLSNNSRLIPPSPERSQWTSLGDQTEAALRVAALKAGLDEQVLTGQLPRIHEIPFDARRKRMSTIHRRVPDGFGEGGQTDLVFVKGAPREVLQLCHQVLVHGQARPLDAALRAEILAVNDEFAHNALRVLALARRELPARTEDSKHFPGGLFTAERVERGLVFLGLMAMMDPPRPEVAKAVKACRRASVRLVMITGDYGLTAASLARRVGLFSTNNPKIVTGAEVEELNDFELQALLNQEVLFARMAPEHKLRLVSAFQARGDVVAVTGDGVNDTPALRKADVGIVMGICGTDVAKEAADVILTDDNFGAIASAIAEGRAIYDNLRKFITYIFSSNVPELMPFVLTPLIGVPLALTVSQILAIDVGTDLFPALALGAEKPEPNAMQHPPRRRDQRLIDAGLLRRSFLWLGMIEAGLCFMGFFAVYALSGNGEALGLPILDTFHLPQLFQIPASEVAVLAGTVYFAGVVTAQVGNAFACRTERARGRYLGWFSNPSLWGAIGASILIALLLIYSPINHWFDMTPLPVAYWAVLILYAPGLYALDWMRKVIVRRHRKDQKSPVHPVPGYD
jgi:Ca2+-transporting ATPase